MSGCERVRPTTRPHVSWLAWALASAPPNLRDKKATPLVYFAGLQVYGKVVGVSSSRSGGGAENFVYCGLSERLRERGGRTAQTPLVYFAGLQVYGKVVGVSSSRRAEERRTSWIGALVSG